MNMIPCHTSCQQDDEPFQHLPLTRLIIIKHALINRYFQSKFNGTRFVEICVEMGLLTMPCHQKLTIFFYMNG